MNIKYLGIFATPEEIAYIKHCQQMPLMAFTNPAPPGPGVPATIPFAESPQQAAHNAALAHGLPEIEGYYGIKLNTGEFVKAEDYSGH